MLFAISTDNAIEFKDYGNQFNCGRIEGEIPFVAVKVFEQIKTGLGITVRGQLKIWDTRSKNVLKVGFWREILI